MKTFYRFPLVFGTACLMLVAGATYSCKDFLVGTPQGTLDERTLASRVGVEGTLIAAYRALDWTTGVGGAWGSAASNWVWGSVPSDDAYKGSEPTDQPPITDIELYNWSTEGTDSYLNDKWRGVYEGVVRSNATLRLLKSVLAQKPGEITPTNANGIRGEALFLRAHYHFEAWRMWGGYAPYYVEDDTDFRKPNNLGSDSVVKLILRDLDEAISLLPETPRNGNVGRATQWTAKAYKGRVQVYNKDYAGALTTLRPFRTSGPYALEASYDRVWTGFQAFANGKETILAFQASANDGEPDGNNANYGERLNFPHSGSPFGCCGFHQPSQNLVNFFAVDAAGLPLAVTDPAGWNARNAEFDGSFATVPVDPRLDWTVGRDNVPFKDWGLHVGGWIRAPGFGGPYSAKKNIHEKSSGAQSNVGWVNTQLNSVNIHIYRFADLLLLLAEAEVEAGDHNAALTIVNEIRARAGQRAQGCGAGTSDTILVKAYPVCAGDSRLAVPINDASIVWADYEIGQYPAALWTPAFAKTAVQYERRLELAMEGHRFFDLRRWEMAQSVLNSYLVVERGRRSFLTAAAALDAKYNLYPLPAIQIELSKVGGEERLQQNPQW